MAWCSLKEEGQFYLPLPYLLHATILANLTLLDLTNLVTFCEVYKL
jgi:hypothetical protein